MQRVINVAITIILVISLFITIQACLSKSEATPVAVPKETGPLLSTKPAWEQEWERTLNAAKKEGQVTFYTQYGSAWRQAFSEAMAKKYSVNMDFVVGSTAEYIPRLVMEQRNRLFIADALSISSSMVPLVKSESILQPLEKMLILPEVLDTKAWYGGQLLWFDPDEKSLVAIRDAVTSPMVVNTDLVKPGELRSWNDLLDPKWKGKILVLDPTINSGGQQNMIMLAYKIKDWDFIKAFLKQEPTLLRDNRLTTEWVAKGKYPIVIGPRKEEVYEFIQTGAPLKWIIPSEGTYTTIGDGNIGLTKSSLHPNAAKVFINFLLSKEGQTLHSKTSGLQSLRVDVPTDHLLPETVRQPGMKYFSTNDKEYLEKEGDLRKEVTKIFEDYLKK